MAVECGQKADKHNSRDSNQILLKDKDQQILIGREKSAIYDCLVLLLY